jgi:hypothetical protein
MNIVKLSAMFFATTLVTAASQAFAYESIYAIDREFSEQGLKEFSKYIDRLESDEVYFSLTFSGEDAARSLRYSDDFGVYYDELVDLAQDKVSASGSIHISEAIMLGRELASGRSDRLLPTVHFKPEFREFSESGKAHFEDYIRGLEEGSTSFSIKSSGVKAAHKNKYSDSFIPFYDELYDLTQDEIKVNGSVHISKVVALAKEVIASKFPVQPVAPVNTVDENMQKAKDNCLDIGFEEKTPDYASCVLDVFSKY